MIPHRKRQFIRFLGRHKHRHRWINNLRDNLLVRWRQHPIMGTDELLWTEMCEALSHDAYKPQLAALGITVTGESPVWKPGGPNPKSWPNRDIITREGVKIGYVATMWPREVEGLVERLEPCPFCGGTDLLVLETGGINCRSCQAQVLGAGSTDDVTTWNRRSLSRPQPDEGWRPEREEIKKAIWRYVKETSLDEATDAILALRPAQQAEAAMTTSAPVPANHPLMIAWKAYSASDDYANTARWAVIPEHTKGSLWAAFSAGFEAALALRPSPPVQEEG